MSLTCVQKILSSFLAIGALSISVSAEAAKKPAPKQTESAFAAPVSGVVSVSDYELNTFVFNEAVKMVHFPGGVSASKPIYMANNTQVMLQFPKSKQPIQMVVELASGSTSIVRVMPSPIPGVVHTASQAAIKPLTIKGKKGTSTVMQSSDPRSVDVDILKSVVVNGEPSSEFEPLPLPRPIAFDKFSVVPLGAWSDGSSKRIFSFSIVASPGQTAVVAPPMFYREGISAIVLDNEVVDANNSPNLLVIEDFQDE